MAQTAVRGAAVELPPSGLFINGSFVKAEDGATFPTYEAASGQVLMDVASAGEADVNRAVEAAREAFVREWSELGLRERGRVLSRVADLIEERGDQLTLLEVANSGKPIRDVRRGEIQEAASWFRFYANIGDHLRSTVIPSPGGYLNYTVREPFGVVGLIIPWNYPLIAAAMKLAPALGAGNAVVLKPAEQTPLSALVLGEICNEAGVPAGVLNIVNGAAATGRALVAHPAVSMISFTGSTEVGREILGRAADQVKHVSVELGGKTPSIVFADADLETAAATILFSFCGNLGQRCTAGTRLVIEKSVQKPFLEILSELALALRIGDPLEDETQLGCLIDEHQFRRVQGFVDGGVAEGAELVIGGKRASVRGCEGGFFYEPTIFNNVDSRARLAQEEIFGPVLSTLSFESEDQAVELANATPYGLSAGVWTRDTSRAQWLAGRLESGRVWINTMNINTVPSPRAPFKQSGLGFEGGVEHALEFTQLKSVWLNLGASPPRL
jgi:acyl-CoA reductase-like NAD-dependent aldehyde dehydrogenase